MAKLEFKKTDNRPNRKRELRTAEIPEPNEKYSPEKAREEFKASQSNVTEVQTEQPEQSSEAKLIETKKQTTKTVRVSEYNIDRMKALETILSLNAHNDLITMALDHLTTTMSKDEISTYKLLMESFNRM